MEDEDEQEEEAKGGMQKSRGPSPGGWEEMLQYAFPREHSGFFSRCSAKARESGFQAHGRRERKTLHRERFAKEMAKGKTE